MSPFRLPTTFLESLQRARLFSVAVTDFNFFIDSYEYGFMEEGVV